MHPRTAPALRAMIVLLALATAAACDRSSSPLAPRQNTPAADARDRCLTAGRLQDELEVIAAKPDLRCR